MGFTLAGLLLMSVAPNFGVLLVAAALVGCGSSVFHPESSRVARMASGGRHGLAQFAVPGGRQRGHVARPLLAALIVIPHGQHSIAWFSVAALVGILVLTQISRWYKQHPITKKARGAQAAAPTLPRGKVVFAMSVLVLLVFSKYFYLTSINSYFTFYLIDKFHLPVQAAQIHLFVFLAAVAAGTIIGGPVGDRIGRKYVIWVSILGVAPFTLLLPYANLFWTGVLTVVIGIVLASAFSAILVYAQELIPGKVGMVSGLFFGFAFGLGGIGAAVLGQLADATSIAYVYKVCSFLPLLGMMTVFLPNVEGKRAGGLSGLRGCPAPIRLPRRRPPRRLFHSRTAHGEPALSARACVLYALLVPARVVRHVRHVIQNPRRTPALTSMLLRRIAADDPLPRLSPPFDRRPRRVLARTGAAHSLADAVSNRARPLRIRRSRAGSAAARRTCATTQWTVISRNARRRMR